MVETESGKAQGLASQPTNLPAPCQQEMFSNNKVNSTKGMTWEVFLRSPHAHPCEHAICTRTYTQTHTLTYVLSLCLSLLVVTPGIGPSAPYHTRVTELSSTRLLIPEMMPASTGRDAWPRNCLLHVFSQTVSSLFTPGSTFNTVSIHGRRYKNLSHTIYQNPFTICRRTYCLTEGMKTADKEQTSQNQASSPKLSHFRGAKVT